MGSSSNAKACRDALLDVLRAIDGTGGYAYDFSGEDQVVVTDQASPPRPGVPCITLYCARSEPLEAPTVNHVLRQEIYNLVAWLPIAGLSGLAVDDAVHAIKDDLHKAIGADITLGLTYCDGVEFGSIETFNATTSTLGIIVEVGISVRNTLAGGL